MPPTSNRAGISLVNDGVGEQAERELILHAAAEEFFAHGYRKAALGDVAARAGVAPARLRHHFATKAALLVEAAGREAQDFFGSVVRSLGQGSSSPTVLTTAIVELQAGPRLPMHRLLAETLVSAIREPQVRRELDPHLRYVFAAVAVVIEAAKDDGLIDADVDVDATVYACVSLMFGSCLTSALDLAPPDAEAARTVILRFVDGLAPEPSATIDLRPSPGRLRLISPAAARPPLRET